MPCRVGGHRRGALARAATVVVARAGYLARGPRCVRAHAPGAWLGSACGGGGSLAVGVVRVAGGFDRVVDRRPGAPVFGSIRALARAGQEEGAGRRERGVIVGGVLIRGRALGALLAGHGEVSLLFGRGGRGRVRGGRGGRDGLYSVCVCGGVSCLAGVASSVRHVARRPRRERRGDCRPKPRPATPFFRFLSLVTPTNIINIKKLTCSGRLRDRRLSKLQRQFIKNEKRYDLSEWDGFVRPALGDL